MKLFTIGDLHLSLSVNKPMDIFGSVWANYMEKIENNWQRLVDKEDVVVICGDVSWAINFEELTADFSFLNRLNGKKYIVKGNHDYWWSTMKKMQRYLEDHAFDTISFLHNTSVPFGGYALCGTRGWFLDEDEAAGNQKIFQRELMRLETSLKHAQQDPSKEKVVFLHYPPIYGGYRCDPVIDLMQTYNVTKCFFGHLHGVAHQKVFEGVYKNIRFKLISADFLNFAPYLIAKS
jgi:predicted phosphohydrolase